MTDAVLTALRHTDRVAAALAQRILSGAWSEDNKLPADTALCAEFDVSRTVIREALRLLSGKGLIIAVPRRGTHVAKRQNWALWDKDVLNWLANIDLDNNKYDFSVDALDMRLALEPTLAALAAARADDADNHALQDALLLFTDTAVVLKLASHEFTYDVVRIHTVRDRSHDQVAIQQQLAHLAY